ncbi:hypothetical protein [His 1 virus]|uniref:Uncharacterized protein ORF4 n=1 Tax=His1 virus (isolate Australia/Victoria) TaxID=654912 RepID=Y04_HIS1I|nr:hypothetical protein His1V_gp04 [His 1 virus]Q25BJ1.1 RecName: Full=Uncharacterized protein ORF4 [His1 virus (isolate Victoria)]AAQ13719.1 hypothetical protein [His 1 virus]
MTNKKNWKCAGCKNRYSSFDKEKKDGQLKFNCPNCGHTVRRYTILGGY